MNIMVFTTSRGFQDYFAGLFDHSVEFRSVLTEPALTSENIYFLHISSFGDSGFDWIKSFSTVEKINLVLCADKPDISEMLESVQLGVKAYCNSYMHQLHYSQLIRLVQNGQSWFPPEMLNRTFELAHKAINGTDQQKLLIDLTEREKDIAIAVAKGLSNKEIASEYSVSEPTVKTHLTSIFKKLHLKDRVALVLYLK